MARLSAPLILAIILVLLFLSFNAGCTRAPMEPTPMEENSNNMAGIIKMPRDGVLVIRMFHSQGPPHDLFIERDNPSYKELIYLVGGIKPGEKKLLPRTIGEVHMNADRSITYWYTAGELTIYHAKSGDGVYRGMLSSVGGLEPGESKMIPAK